jgi:hypothetical protein
MGGIDFIVFWIGKTLDNITKSQSARKTMKTTFLFKYSIQDLYASNFRRLNFISFRVFLGGFCDKTGQQ